MHHMKCSFCNFCTLWFWVIRLPCSTRSKTTVTDHHVFTDWIDLNLVSVAMDSDGYCYQSVMVFLLGTIGSSNDYFFYKFSTFLVVYFNHKYVMTPVWFFSSNILDYICFRNILVTALSNLINQCFRNYVNFASIHSI